jgi:hypothetical protein
VAMDEKTALEEIAYIKKIIDDSRKTIIYNGREFIFWGILVSIGMVFTYFGEILHKYTNIFLFWFILIAIGWLYAGYNAYVDKKKAKKATFSNKIIGAVWLTFGITSSMIGFVGTYSHGINPDYLNAIFASLLAAQYYITGIIVNYKLFKNLSFFWWLGSAIMFLFPGNYVFLLMAAMMICFQVIPGIIIYRKYKKEMNTIS